MVEAAALSGTIRAVTRADVAALKALIDTVGLFPSSLLDDMLAGYLGGDHSQGFWLAIDDGGPVGIAYCAPERMTLGTWNLLLIAVHPGRQGQGRGTALLGEVERALAVRGERLLLVETSGLPEFAKTRAFYARCGYAEEARIRDFYQEGEDKVVFSKALAEAVP
jgi:GNAT superfamily N-acetyltransferase